MHPLLRVLAAAALIVGCIGYRTCRMNSVSDLVTMSSYRPAAPSSYEAPVGLCPWRDPSGDCKRFFPRATGYLEETLVLSRYRLEMARRLGRKPTGEENAIVIHRVFRDRTPLGVAVARRLRGESGVLELIVAVDNHGSVIGSTLQRSREPEETTRFLRSKAWSGAFCGKTANDPWRLAPPFPAPPQSAAASAQIVLSGVRDALILLDIGERSLSSRYTTFPMSGSLADLQNSNTTFVSLSAR